MIISLENTDLQLQLNPTNTYWSVLSRHRHGSLIEGAQLGIEYRSGRRRIRTMKDRQFAEMVERGSIQTLHGPAERIIVDVHTVGSNLPYRVAFVLPEQHPLLLWRISLDNRTDQPLAIDTLELLRVGFPTRSSTVPISTALSTYPFRSPMGFQGRILPHPDVGDLAFYSNGWASWSFSGVLGQLDRHQHSRLGFLRLPATHNATSPRPRRPGHFVSEMFGVLGSRIHRSAILTGFLSQQQHFGTVEAWSDPQHASLRLWAHGDGATLAPGEQIETDWACVSFLHLDTADPLGPYLEAVRREHHIDEAPKHVPTGWCSWYRFFEDLTPRDLRSNLEALKAKKRDIDLEVFQIDDGYTTRIGDWHRQKRGFRRMMPLWADRIKRSGFLPGLWLAPFIIHRGAEIAREHPGWLLRNRFGQPVNAGYNWGTLMTALDLSHEEALEHIQEVIHRAVHKWGFPYLKLDFLYAGALPGRRSNPHLTRAQAYRAGLARIREAAGAAAFLLGCGAPIGSSIGLVDAMRIGADVAESWHPRYAGVHFFFRHERDFPAASNSIQNTLTRASFHRRWWINDPDCLLLRPNTSLTLAEVQSLASAIALSGGTLFVSDHMADLTPGRLQILKKLLPVIGERPHVLDWFDHMTPSRLQLDLDGPAGPWHLLGLFNWSTSPQDLELRLSSCFLEPQRDYLARAFWSGKDVLISDGHAKFAGVPANGVVMVALRRYLRHQPQYIGSDLHISQGQEVADWQVSPEGLMLRLERPGLASGEVELYLPREPVEAILNDEPVVWQKQGDSRYIFKVRFNRRAELAVRLGSA